MAVEGALAGTPLRPGDPERLGPYRLLRRLGSGGMGSVYLAEDARGALVALKVIRADLADDDEFRRRFRSEVARAREVPPFCTAEVLDADPEHETPYLVVEYVEGPSLADVVVARGPLSPANLHGLAIGVATALTAIHSAGIIHRDLKPANVLLAPGSPKVIDFGIARGAESGDGETATDQLIGTVAYMAPERLDPGLHRRKLTQAADVFAWGAVVAFAATGRVPFMADSSPATAVAILTREPDLDGVPPTLRDLVGRSLAKNPADRPTARELLDALLTTTSRPVVPAGSTTVVVPPVDLPGGEPDRLTSGLRAAVVNVTDERTRVAPAAEAPDATEVVRPRGSRWRTIGVTLLVLAVLATGGTLAAVLGGYLKLPGAAAAGEPTPPVTVTTPPTSPPASASAGVVPAGTAATAGYQYRKLVDSPLAAPDPRTWVNDPDTPGQMGRCVVDGGLLAQLNNHQSWRCAGPTLVHPADLRVVVDMSLLTEGACAGVWVRFDATRPKDADPGPGGYALQVCQRGWHLLSHDNDLFHALAAGAFPTALGLGVWSTVQVEVIGSTITVWLDGKRLGDPYTDSMAFYTDGHTVLGALVNAVPIDPITTPFKVRFRNAKIYGITPAQ